MQMKVLMNAKSFQIRENCTIIKEYTLIQCQIDMKLKCHIKVKGKI